MNVIQNLNFMKAITELVPKLIQQALWIVVVTTIVGFALAIVIGFLLALGRLSKHKWLVNIIVIFQEIIRGTPLLVQLVYIYYVVPLLIQVCAYFVGFPDLKVSMPAVLAGIIGIAINYGTYISEVIRSAIVSIDNGQTEAALALAMTPRQAMFKIVIPQAFRNSIPVFGNYLVMLVKDTSLMAYITAPEFLLVTKAYTSQTFLTIDTIKIIVLGLIAFCMGTAFGVLFGKIMYVATGGKVNPLIGSAGVSAVPMAARVSQKVGQQENPGNFLLMHAMGPNVAGVIGSAVAAGVLLNVVG